MIQNFRFFIKNIKKHRNRYHKVLREKRDSFYDMLFEEHKNDSKTVFKILNKLTDSAKNPEKKVLPSIYSQEELPDIFREFYVDKIHQIDDKITAQSKIITVDAEKFKPNISAHWLSRLQKNLMQQAIHC